ncbi:hypothetical protein L244_14985 [Salmonella enterica subsp. enterica serovar Worthington str. BCH-3194]|nr:hypothetical protein L244_14985 [Salmonella enterica subsp. enterica serovar Worthington str. BCH-3194]
MIAFWPGQYSCAGKAADLSTGISAAYSHFQGGKPSGFYMILVFMM